MATISILISLAALFYGLGRAADLAIYNLRIIGEKLQIKIFFLGILLGFFTSLPELAIGINSAVNNISPIALGNLLGGIIVLFSLVLGISAILNRKIVNDEKKNNLLPIFAYLIFPIALGFDGLFSFFDGLLFIGGYFLLLFYLYRKQHYSSINKGIIISPGQIMKNIFLVIIGLALVVIISNILIRFTNLLLEQWAIPTFIIGLILFSLGTNLPEIIVTVRSWRKNLKDLSISNLIGSGMANIFILGLLVLIEPIPIEERVSFYILAFFMIFLLASVLFFYKTDKHLTQKEGLGLIAIYGVFIIAQLCFILGGKIF